MYNNKPEASNDLAARSIGLTVLEALNSQLESGLTEQITLLNEIDYKLNKVKLIREPDNMAKNAPVSTETFDFHTCSLRQVEVLYANNQRLHKIINHLSQII